MCYTVIIAALYLGHITPSAQDTHMGAALQVMAMWLWIALFTLPFMYQACRHALDALVEETLLFVAEVVRGGEESLPRTVCMSSDVAANSVRSTTVCTNGMRGV